MGKALVAKSYLGLEQVGDVYYVNDKAYIKVQMGNGNLKQVRAYSEKEYQKYYPELAAQATADHSNDPYWKSQKEILGFKNGYITIFKGDTYPYKDWFKSHSCLYRKWWGWSFSSEVELPKDIPEGVTPVRLDWNLVGNEETLKNDDLVKAAVEALLYDESGSEYVGNIGDRLELLLTVNKAVKMDGFYGPSTCYVMSDEVGNCFVWTTSSAKVKLEVDNTYWIRGTVKSHKLYKNMKQTNLSRCIKVEKDVE